MSSSDASYVSSSDSEASETEVEYALEAEGSSDPSEHETSDDEPGDTYAYGSSAPSKGIRWSDILSVLLSRLLQPKITHLSGVFPLFDLQKRNGFFARKQSMALKEVTNNAIPRPFSVTLWLGLVFKIHYLSEL